MRNLGLLALARGDPVGAEGFFRRAETIEAKAFGETSDGVYRIRTLIAAAPLRQGRVAEAAPLLEHSYEKLYANGRVMRAGYDRTLEELAGPRLSQERLVDAGALYAEALLNDLARFIHERPQRVSRDVARRLPGGM